MWFYIVKYAENGVHCQNVINTSNPAPEKPFYVLQVMTKYIELGCNVLGESLVVQRSSNSFFSEDYFNLSELIYLLQK